MPTYRVTLPPSNYPPTAPYANLSDHFARLVRRGLLRAVIIKMLLYPQSRQSIDMKSIPLRKTKCHKASKRIEPRLSHETDSLERADLERQDAFELPTDSESGGSGADFEYIHMSKHDSLNSTGTFIDHGSGAATPNKNVRHCSSINLINLESTSDEGSVSPLKKESLVIGSKTMKAIGRNSSQQSVIIHTSEARLELGSNNDMASSREHDDKHHLLLQQQTSEASGKSSVYGGRLGGAYLACENLADMCDETKIKNNNSSSAPVALSPPERHSMPNIFVGNRFNRSSKTSVYVPTWKDRNDMQNQSADVAADSLSPDTVDGEIHASTLDLPAMCREAPDQLQAELLYNFNESDVISPPSLYKTSYVETVPIRKSNDSTKTSQTELCIEPRRNSNNELKTKLDSIKRCISYHYVPLAGDGEEPGNEGNQIPPDRNENRRFLSQDTQDSSCTKCKCCESSQCPSPRSSDSGMAGSCTITSPDPPQHEGTYEAYYDVDGNLQLLSNNTNVNDDLTRFDVCGTFREKFLDMSQQPYQLQQQQQQQRQSDNEAFRPLQTCSTLTSVTSLEFQRNSKSIFINSMAPSSSKPSTSNLTFTSSNEHTSPDNTTDSEASSAMFRSGMYAHWWKKENLPHDLVKSIAKVCKKHLPSPQASVESHCSLCSGSFCSMGASGYSEGATYCSLCQDCCNSSCSSSSLISTNTTTTITSAECPLCSNTTQSSNAEVYPTSSRPHTLLSSPSSSVECPICSGKYLARGESLSSGREDETAPPPLSSSRAEGKHFKPICVS